MFKFKTKLIIFFIILFIIVLFTQDKKKSLSDSSKKENDEALQKVEKEKLFKTLHKGYELIGGK